MSSEKLIYICINCNIKLTKKEAEKGICPNCGNADIVLEADIIG